MFECEISVLQVMILKYKVHKVTIYQPIHNLEELDFLKYS